VKTINDDVAIHDEGFQFYVLLNLISAINRLIEDLLIIEKCMNCHAEWKKESWYNSKTQVSICESIQGFHFSSKFTYKEISALYKERKAKYDFLIEILVEALADVKKSYEENKRWKPPYGNSDRSDILIEHFELDYLKRVLQVY
jgi:hypothetical protein